MAAWMSLSNDLSSVASMLRHFSAVEDNPPPPPPTIGPLHPLAQWSAAPSGQLSGRPAPARENAFKFHLAALEYALGGAPDIMPVSESARLPHQPQQPRAHVAAGQAQSCWIPDLTAEGIEPNPGPTPEIMEVDEPLQLANPPTMKDIEDTPFQKCAELWKADPQDKFGPQLRQLDNGLWCQRIEMASPELIECVTSTQGRPIDILFPGDGLPNPYVPERCDSFHLFNQNAIQPTMLAGKHTLLFFPRPLPFEDRCPVFSFKSWCALCKETLHRTSSMGPTLLSIVFQSRHQSPTPTVLPLLDRRFELDGLRKFLHQVVILPDVTIGERSADGSVGISRNCGPMPFMLYAYSNSIGRGSPVSTVVKWRPPSAPDDLESNLHLPPDARATHVLMNCVSMPQTGAPAPALSAIRIVMALNQMDPSETTTQFRAAPMLRYPAEPLPHIQRSTPDNVVIAHYHVPPNIVQFLDEDRESLHLGGIDWVALPEKLEGFFVVNHMPQRRKDTPRPFKCQALEVRDGILAAPSVSNLLEWVMILNRWDVLIKPRFGVEPSMLSGSLQNLDNYTLLDANQMSRVVPQPGLRCVEPPNILVFYPLHMVSSYVLSVVASIAAVESHQDSGKPGVLAIRFQSAHTASLLYGLRLSSTTGAVAFSCGLGAKDAEWETSMGLPPNASLAERKSQIIPLSEAPRLSVANLFSSQLETGSKNGSH